MPAASRNEITNSGGVNNQRGILLYEWGEGDAREITIDTVTLKETLYYSTTAVNQPRDNRIIDSWFGSYNYPRRSIRLMRRPPAPPMSGSIPPTKTMLSPARPAAIFCSVARATI